MSAFRSILLTVIFLLGYSSSFSQTTSKTTQTVSFAVNRSIKSVFNALVNQKSNQTSINSSETRTFYSQLSTALPKLTLSFPANAVSKSIIMSSDKTTKQENLSATELDINSIINTNNFSEHFLMNKGESLKNSILITVTN